MTPVTATYPVAPPEPGLTGEELIARAREIAPTLVERQAETERRTFYAQDTHERFKEAGFFRMLVPKRYGGYEVDLATFMEVGATITQGCSSTGWMMMLSAGHAQQAAMLFDQRAQDEIFAVGDFVCPEVVQPQGRAERVDDGWIINGVFNYCTGSPYATHYMGNVMPADAPTDGSLVLPLIFIAPRSAFTRLDNWGDSLGLKGSGSHSIEFKDAWIPEYFVLENQSLLHVDGSQQTPGLAQHGNGLYAGSVLSFIAIELATACVGMARAAIDCYDELMRTKATMMPPIVPRPQSPDYQLWYGEGVGKVAAAECAWRDLCQQWSALSGSPDFSFAKDRTLVTVCREIQRLCWSAIDDHFFRTAGSSSIRDGHRIERLWRDMSMVHSHTGVANLHMVAARELTGLSFPDMFGGA